MSITADAGVRDKLKAIRENLSQVRSERVRTHKEREAAKEAFGKLDLAEVGNIVKSNEFLEVEKTQRDLGALDDTIAELESAESAIVKALGERQEPTDLGRHSQLRSAHDAMSAAIGPWDGRTLLNESDEYESARERGLFTSKHQFGTVSFGEIASREAAMQFLAAGGGHIMGAALPGAPAGPVGTPPAGIPPDFRGIIPPRVRRLTLLDLIPTGTTDSNVVEYVQVTAIPVGAAETAELAVKPELGLSTVDATAPVRTIAGWIKAARQALDDMPGLATLINTLLPYEVRRRVEGQVLSGDGIGQNLLGITNTTGIGAPSAVTGDNAADAILRAMTVIILSDSDPNFATINPLTWQSLLLLREQTNDQTQTLSWKGEYLYGPPGTLASPTVWGLTITPSRIIGTNNPLVGDSSGATLLVREGLNVKTSDSDQDDFVRNRVTVLAETRVAFPVWRPSAFCLAAF